MEDRHSALTSDAPAPRPSLQGPVEPNPTDVLLVSYPDSMDGFTAAWIVSQIARRDQIPVEFVNKGAEMIFQPEPKEILGRNWISICDDGFPAGTFGKSLLTFMRCDTQPFAPLPYRNWKRTQPFGIETMASLGKVCGVHDSKKSLCRLVWEFFCADRVGFDKPSRLISHIDDYTTGTLRYNDSEAIAAAVSSYAHDFTIYDRLAKAVEDKRRREAMIAAGQGIARYIKQIAPKA
jgi:hypothetical protein